MLFWVSLLLLVSIAYALLVVWALPKLILKSNFPITHPTDRGLKRYKFSDEDYAVVYEPSLAARKYITQYILAKKDGKKTFKCKFAPDVTFLDFDIALFNAQGECFRSMNCMNVVEASGLSNETELPEETAYASIFINQVNETRLQKKQQAQVGKGRIFVFGFFTLLLSIGMAIGMLFSLSNIFGGLLRESFVNEMMSSGWIFLIPTVICAVLIAIACYQLFLRNSKR